MDWGEFVKTDRAGWLKQAEADIKGKSDIQAWNYSAAGLPDINPFLTQDEAPNLPSLSVLPTLPGVFIEGDSPEECNTFALRMLENGASCLWFNICDDWNPEVLFKDIYLEMIATVVTVRPEAVNFPKAMRTYLQHVTPEAREKIIHPGFFSGASHRYVKLSANEDFGIRAAKIHEAVQGLNANDNKEALFFHVQLKTDFFAQMAELRTIRMLMKDIGQSSDKLFIAATIVVPAELKESIHPLIPVCYQLLSAHLGMGTAAFGMSVSEGEELARLSLNIQHIFAEEGKLDYVSDPMAGAYITDTLSRLMMQEKR